jgi:YfiR/HmsC-like
VAFLNPWIRGVLAEKGMAPKAGFRQFPAAGRSGLILLAVCAFMSGEAVTAPSHGLTEYEIKAGFLFNFTKFVEWPEGTFVDSNAPIVLGVVGEHPVGNLLTETFGGKAVNGRAVLVRQFKAGQDLRGCQVLFIASTDKKQMVQILEKLRGSTVLTVGEGSGFTQSGGMIAFLVEGNKVRLEIDLEAASEAHLKISAKVIAVAGLVAHEGRGKK